MPVKDRMGVRILFVFLSLLLSQVAWAADDATRLLERMSHAVENLNYEGTFVYIHGRRTETMQIIHGQDGGIKRERLLSLTGEPREIVKDDQVLTCIYPGTRSVVVEPRRNRLGLPAVLPDRHASLSAHYELQLGEPRRVAGILCRIVDIVPRDALRYGHRLCIDEGSAMLLMSEMLDHEQRVIEQFMFTSIGFPSEIPRARFEPVTGGEGFTTYRVESGQTDTQQPDPAWHIQTLPAGFELTSNTRRSMASSQSPVQHMILTDGLASVSVFIARPESLDDMTHGSTRAGALHAYALPVADHQVTVVGEVPMQTVRMIGESVTYRGAR
jgi:sigma-E factor negative regulatory protein RseB